MPVGDLVIALAVLTIWPLPRTTTVALISAAVAGALVTRVASPAICSDPSDTALRAAGKPASLMLIAFPVAWVDGVPLVAALATASLILSVGVYRYFVARVACGPPARPRRVAILGTGPLGLEVGEYLIEQRKRRRRWLQPVGFIDGAIRGTLPLPLLGEPGDLERIIADHDLDTVIVAFGGFAESELIPVLRRCEELPVEVVVLPRFFELSLAEFHHELWGFPVARLQGPAERRATWRIKRVVDVMGAGAILLLAAPVMAVVAVAVRLSSSGPILYRQLRVGHRGRVFEMLKFRSMLENDDGDTTWSVDEDDRVTPVGRFIRLTHLDELPQLFNVLRGDMSLVGPRPMRPHFVKLFGEKIDRYDDRHRVPVGLTGWSQVNGLSGDTSVEARVRLDNRYIESWSLRRDLAILLKTIPTVFRHR